MANYTALGVTRGAHSANYASRYNQYIQAAARPRTFFKPYSSKVMGIGDSPEIAGAVVVDFTSALSGPLKGKTVTWWKNDKIKGAGVTGTTALVGNEEKPHYATQSISISLWRHAVGWDRFSQDQLYPDIKSNLFAEQYPNFVARHIDHKVMSTMASGITTKWIVNTQGSTGVAGMTTGGMAVDDLATYLGALQDNMAKPIRLRRMDNGQDQGVFAALMPAFQVRNLLSDTTFKSQLYIQYDSSANNPFNQGFVTRYENLLIFSYDTDIDTGGSFLEPKCRLYTAMTAGTAAMTIFVSASGSQASLTQYFDSGSGWILIGVPGGTFERVKYTSKNRYSFRLSKRVAGTRTAHSTNCVIMQDHAKCLFFGRELIAMIHDSTPERIQEVQDYGELIGEGIRYVEGYGRMLDVNSRTNNIYVVGAAANRKGLIF